MVGDTMKQRILIVANQTLGGEELAATVRERVHAGATDVYVVVPVTKPPNEYVKIVIASEGGPYQSGPGRVGRGRRLPAGRGAPAPGTGPFRRCRDHGGRRSGQRRRFYAVSSVMSRHEFDEVIVSTLRAGSRAGCAPTY